ncbi:MAG: lipid-A-disaccharide synthase N-terminal domain-containing protein [Phycisphaeraceae bacterium]|nr:lipid-A-disaccharide synthase N-terminal domain-containing protein [Phycisphaeraceae bacterium]
MALVLGLGLWLAFDATTNDRFPLEGDAIVTPIRIGDEKGVVEAFQIPCTSSDGWRFRLWFRNDSRSPPALTTDQAESLLSARVVRQCIEGRRPVYRWLNITSWVGFVWVCVGFAGQLLFSGRMILQWITSERSRRSVISESFWWFSLAGGVTLFAYFIWRQDPVPMLGQAAGIVIYARNIRLLRKHARRTRIAVTAS